MLGVYDSGVGGLTIVREIRLRTGLKTMYLADSLNAPLGEKSPREIRQIVVSGVASLLDVGCQLVILACNTATCETIRFLQREWLPDHYPDRKVLGIVRPVTEHVLGSVSDPYDKILLLATPATILSGFYQQELAGFGLRQILSLPVAGLAMAIEKHDLVRVDAILDKVFLEAGTSLVDVQKVILACTHYPLVADRIRRKLIGFGLPKNLQLIDQAVLVAEGLLTYMHKHSDLDLPEGSVEFMVNGHKQNFIRSLESWPDLAELLNSQKGGHV